MTTRISERVSLDSGGLADATYNEILGELELGFRDGERYRYSGVAPEIFRALLCADSKGGYFNRHIRTHFRYVKLPVEN